MPLDRITEEIAHFIGLFQLDTEAARMRDSYDAFRAARDDLPPPNDLPEVTISVRAPYEVVPFEPALKAHLAPSPLPVAAASAAAMPGGAAAGGDLNFTTRAWQVPPEKLADAIRTHPFAPEPYWDVPPPNSIVSVTVQSLTLSDNDFLDFGQGHAFVSPEVFTAELMEMVGIAQSLALDMSALLTPGEVPSVEAVIAAIAEAEGAGGAGGATVTVSHGAAAMGIVVNGAKADAMPVFRDNLPQALRADDAAEDGEGEADNPFAVEPGHHVMAGGNLSTNEVHIWSNWVDAPVISVMGDVVKLNLISQVTLLSEHDTGSQPGAPSWAVNAAQIELLSSEPDDAADVDAAPVLPAHWQIETIEGDVVALNWLQQYIFATDNDRAEIMVSGGDTGIWLGANTLGNLTTLADLGFHYDLIVVGGSMITMNLIQQISVLLDSDAITGTLAAADVRSGGDNYLQNSAAISTTGIDTITAMTDAFRTAGEALAQGAATISAQLAADPLLASKEALSVLYITGDLIEMNAIEQHNYVGDADQVHLALQDFVAGAGDEVTITTGSNALLNDALITDMGIDSTVLAGGEVYSDALIHQAGLIDTDAVPDGVALAALTNEAVAAFLASDMIDPPAAHEDGGHLPPVAGEGGSLDVMQSVLA